MVDTQERLTMGASDAVSKTSGLLVIGAVALLIVLKRLNVKISAS